MRILRKIAPVLLAVSLAACSQGNPIAPGEEKSTQSQPGSASEGSSASVPDALRESWEKEGVYMANDGSFYSEKCPHSRDVRVPVGVVTRC